MTHISVHRPVMIKLDPINAEVIPDVTAVDAQHMAMIAAQIIFSIFEPALGS